MVGGGSHGLVWVGADGREVGVVGVRVSVSVHSVSVAMSSV